MMSSDCIDAESQGAPTSPVCSTAWPAGSTMPPNLRRSLLKTKDFRSEELISKICQSVETLIRDHHVNLIADMFATCSEPHRQPLDPYHDLQSATTPTLHKNQTFNNTISSISLRDTPMHTLSNAAPISDPFTFLTSLRQYEYRHRERNRSQSHQPRHGRINQTLDLPRDETGFFKKFATSKIYEVGLCLLIVSHALFMGLQAAEMSFRKSAEPSFPHRVTDWVYLIVFVFEIFVRMIAYGFSFFTAPAERTWNIFDLIIVGVSACYSCLSSSFSRHSSIMKIFEVLRGLRAIRLLRASMRASKSFPRLRPLRLLISSIGETLGCCFWALLLLLAIVYIFGLSFAYGAIHHLYICEEPAVGCDDRDPDIYRFFGTLEKSLLTLFQSICGGVDWGDPMNALLKMGAFGGLYGIGFMLYVGFTYFAVLNVVTALFCQNAVESSMTDQDVLLEKKSAGLIKMRNKLQSLFRVLEEVAACARRGDDSPTGMFTLTDLEVCMADDKLCGDLALLGIEADDAWTLFKLLDVEDAGAIDVDCFVSGCMSLRGNATKMDFRLLSYENRFLLNKLDAFMLYMVKQLGGSIPEDSNRKVERLHPFLSSLRSFTMSQQLSGARSMESRSRSRSLPPIGEPEVFSHTSIDRSVIGEKLLVDL